MCRRLSIYFREMYPILPRFVLGLIIFGEIHIVHLIFNISIRPVQADEMLLESGFIGRHMVSIILFCHSLYLSQQFIGNIYRPVSHMPWDKGIERRRKGGDNFIRKHTNSSFL